MHHSRPGTHSPAPCIAYADANHVLRLSSTTAMLQHQIAAVWYSEMVEAVKSRKLFFLWLANDVLQRNRKTAEFKNAFQEVLLDAVSHFYNEAPAMRSKTERLLGVWNDRGVFPPQYINLLRRAAAGKPVTVAALGISSSAGGGRRARSSSGGGSGSKDSGVQDSAADKALAAELMEAAKNYTEARARDQATANEVAALPEFSVEAMRKITDKEVGRQMKEGTVAAVRVLAKQLGLLSAETDDLQNVVQIINTILQRQTHLAARTQRQLEECEGTLEQLAEVESALADKMLYLPEQADSAAAGGGGGGGGGAYDNAGDTGSQDMELDHDDDAHARKRRRFSDGIAAGGGGGGGGGGGYDQQRPDNYDRGGYSAGRGGGGGGGGIRRQGGPWTAPPSDAGGGRYEDHSRDRRGSNGGGRRDSYGSDGGGGSRRDSYGSPNHDRRSSGGSRDFGRGDRRRESSSSYDRGGSGGGRSPSPAKSPRSGGGSVPARRSPLGRQGSRGWQPGQPEPPVPRVLHPQQQQPLRRMEAGGAAFSPDEGDAHPERGALATYATQQGPPPAGPPPALPPAPAAAVAAPPAMVVPSTSTARLRPWEIAGKR